MPICLAGMPDSGISVVARLLGGLGLDLGPRVEADGVPTDGRFAELNEEVLRALGAGWDSPPARGTDWAEAEQLVPLRRRAADVCGVLALTEPWGWADPRNSLTMPFWHELFPDLRLLVCVRDPREVAASLQAAGTVTRERALGLWEEYYATLLDLGREGLAVTHYDNYRDDPKVELERLARGLGLESSGNAVAWTAAGLKLPAPADQLSDGKLPRRVQELDERLREAAGAPLPWAPPPANAPPARRADGSGGLPEAVEAQRRELEHLRLELARAHGQIDALRAQIEVRAEEPAYLRKVVQNLEEQLVERDEELEELRDTIRAGDAWRREMEALRQSREEELTRGVQTLQGELDFVRSTRLWSTGNRYWKLKARLREFGRRDR